MITDRNLEHALRVKAALPDGGLFHEKTWRVSPRAFQISPAFADELDKLGYRLLQFQKACNQLYRQSSRGRQPSWIAELLDRGKPAELVALARERIFQDALPGVIRPDVILTDGGYVLAELDSVPGGIGLTAWLSGIYSDLGEDVVGGRNGMMDGFASLLPGGDIVVSEEASTYRPEMFWLADQLNARNPGSARWRVVDESEREDWAANVYRFFELFDLENIPAGAQLKELATSGKIRVTPPFKPWMEEKIWFALFWLKPLEAFWLRELSERTFLALREVIPYSWMVDPEPLPPHAVLPRLDAQSWNDVAHFSQKEREFVLKVSGFSAQAWGSRGVVVAQDVPQHTWSDELQRALEAFDRQPHLLQRFHKGRIVEQPWLNEATGELEILRGRVRLCPYYFVDQQPIRCAGALATICPSDKKLLHGMTDAILVPTSVAEESPI